MIPKKIEYHLQSKKRWLIQQGGGCLVTATLPLYGFRDRLDTYAKGYGVDVQFTLSEPETDTVFLIFDEDEFIRRGKKLEQDTKKVQSLIRQWKEKARKFYEFVKSLDERHPTFLQQYPLFYELYLDEYTLPLAAEYYTVWSDHIMKSISSKYPGRNKEIQTLILPDNITFSMENELGLLKIASSHFNEIKKVKKYSQCSTALKKRLTEHQKQYFWISNGYKNFVVLPPEFFLNQLNEMTITKEKIKARLFFLNNYSREISLLKNEAKKIFSKKDHRRMESIGIISWWHDQRKRANLVGLHYQNLFIIAASKHHRVHYDDLLLFTPPEFLNLVNGKQVHIDEIRKRRKGLAWCLIKESSDWVGVEKEFDYCKKILFKSTNSASLEVTGLGASPGTARGKAKIVLNPHKTDFKKGEILVAFMTRPEYIHLMKKAAAFVTDEGGVTSHAAVIGRELKKPVVVGCRFATRTFKDGDIIEVDANKGIVRKI